MRRAINVLSLAAAFVFAQAVMAQTTPNFAGKWAVVLDRTAAAGREGGRGGRGAPGTMGSGWGTDITVTQDATRLTIQTAYFTPRDMQPPLRFVYLLDGSESKNSIMLGRGTQEQVSKAVWDGDKLVITTVHRFKDPQTDDAKTSETRQVLSLASPTSLVIESTHGTALGGQPTTTKTTYRKN